MADEIPIAPGIKLENLINFKGDCIEPLALIIITEALDYALETSARRLKSLGKIFSGVEESAYGEAGIKGILPTIKAVREAILTAPQCTPEGPRVQPIVSSEEAIVTKAASVTHLKKATTPSELLELVKGHPELEKAVKASSERSLPEFWGKAFFHGKGEEAHLTGEYDSPGALAKALGIIVRGAKPTTATAFTRAGFLVRGNGDVPFKTKTGIGFYVTRDKPTPKEWKLPPPEELPEPKEIREKQWLTVRKEIKGKVETIGWDLLDPETGLSVPGARVGTKPTEGKIR